MAATNPPGPISIGCCQAGADMQIKKSYLLVAFVTVSVIALLYGVRPGWFASTFLDTPEIPLDFAHILRAVMGLYLALGVFWLFAAFRPAFRNTAILTTIIFSGGLVAGRILSLLVDGRPSPVLLVYVVMELVLVPIAWAIYRIPE